VPALGQAAQGVECDRQWRATADCVFEKQPGLLGVDLFCQTGNLAGGRSFVQNAFFYSFIDGGFGDVEPLPGIFGIIRRGQIDILDDVLDPGLNGFVALAPKFILNGTFFCGLMIGHLLLLLSGMNWKKYKTSSYLNQAGKSNGFLI
jgi:hypothetical protein